MRAILVLIGLAAIVLIILLSTGMISIDQTKTAQLPEFQTNVGKVELGTENKTVEVPTLTIEKAENAAAPADE